MKRNIGYIVLLLIAIFAFVFCYQCGSRGFFPLDQSIVYDGAWRIIQGQIPFKDFIAPIGPISFLYQAEIFCIFGVNYSSYLIGAAIMNVLAALLTFCIIRIFSRKNMIIPLIGAFISSIWFYSQMGTTYPDQTSMFFCLLSLFCLLYTNRDTDPKKSFILLFTSGFIWTLGFLSKQNYAGGFLPLLYIAPFLMNDDSQKSNNTFLVYRSWKKLLWITLGIIFCSSIFLFWLLIFSDINTFIRYFFQLPIEEGLSRFKGEAIHMKHKYHIAILTASALFAISSIYFIIHFLKTKKENTESKENNKEVSPSTPQNMILVSVIVLYLISYSFIMLKTTNNNAVNAWGFLGLFFGIAYFQLCLLLNQKKKEIGTVASGIVIILFILICGTGINSGWKREIHDFDKNMTYHQFDTPITMNSLKWCNQTRAGSVGGRGVLLKDSDLKRLIKFVRERDADFFIFSDFTALYGFTGKPSPQPLLWFHKGLTYPRKYDPELDSLIVESLKRNKVDTIIFEEVAWLNSQLMIKDFPLLENYMQQNFKQIGYIGFYKIYIKYPN